MKYVSVFILRPDKKLEWRDIGWGKRYLDELKKEGCLILNSFVHENKY
jgi:hypothetical protein